MAPSGPMANSFLLRFPARIPEAEAALRPSPHLSERRVGWVQRTSKFPSCRTKRDEGRVPACESSREWPTAPKWGSHTSQRYNFFTR